MTTLQEAAQKALVALVATIPGANTGTADAWASWHNLRTTAVESLMVALAQQGEPEVLAHDNCLAERICRSWCGNSACVSHTAAPAQEDTPE
jgi:hypothetical protein